MKWAALVLSLVAAGCSDASNTQYLPIGSRCSSSGQCGTSPYDCAISGYPYGYCEKVCALDGDCPSDSLCSPIVKQCRRQCATEATCRVSDGYSCQFLASGKGICEVGSPMDGGSP